MSEYWSDAVHEKGSAWAFRSVETNIMIIKTMVFINVQPFIQNKKNGVDSERTVLNALTVP
jgi:hypothetical protein